MVCCYFSGIWLKHWDTLWQFQLDNYQPGMLYSLVWNETTAALAGRTFAWVVTGAHLVVTISRIPDKQAKKIPHPMSKLWRAPRPEEQSNPGSRQDTNRFPDSRTIFQSNPETREYPSRPSARYNDPFFCPGGQSINSLFNLPTMATCPQRQRTPTNLAILLFSEIVIFMINW